MEPLRSFERDDDRVELHALIAQAWQLVRRFQRAARGDGRLLRDEARALVSVLDAHHPAQSAQQRAFALVRQIAWSDDPSQSKEQHREAELLSRLAETSRAAPRPRHAASSSARDTDAWILDMFRATESAIPRETLVAEFVTRYRRVRHVTDTEKHGGPWLFVFQSEKETGQEPRLIALEGAGVHPIAFEQRCREHLPNWTADPFLTSMLLEQLDVDGWYALPFGGSALFDALLDINRRFDGEANYWISGVALPGDGGDESRAVVVLYPNTADSLSPEPPAGIRQDMRLLTVLGLAWRQLEHQVGALARISEADRRDLINLIAPGLLHHEIGFNMRTAYGQLYEQYNLLTRIATETGRDDIALARDYSGGAAKLVLRLYQITDAFNNLDKRGQVEQSDLQRVLAELKMLLHHRLGSAHTELTWDEELCESMHIQTDIVLLSQAWLNILNNALNALSEHEVAPPRRIRIDVHEQADGILVVDLMNNGPEIAPQVSREMFRRGYTTRSRGHGQGLYLARLVAKYLGGELTHQERSVLPEGFNTGFRFKFQRRLMARQGVAHASQ